MEAASANQFRLAREDEAARLFTNMRKDLYPQLRVLLERKKVRPSEMELRDIWIRCMRFAKGQTAKASITPHWARLQVEAFVNDDHWRSQSSAVPTFDEVSRAAVDRYRVARRKNDLFEATAQHLLNELRKLPVQRWQDSTRVVLASARTFYEAQGGDRRQPWNQFLDSFWSVLGKVASEQPSLSELSKHIIGATQVKPRQHSL